MRRWITALAALAIVAFANPVFAQPAVEAFMPAPAAADSPARAATLARLRREHAARSISIVRLNPQALSSAPVNSTRVLNLSPTVRLQGVTRQSTQLEGGRVLWQGDIAAIGALPKGDATIVVDGQNATGTVTAPDGKRYQIRPIGGGEHAVIELDYSKLPKEEPEGHPRVKAPGPEGGAGEAAASPSAGSPLADAVPTLDLLVAYTPSASSSSGGIDALIDLAIAETNTSFTNSGVNARVRLAGKMALSYSESGKTFDTILSDFVGNAGVTTQRNAVGADVSVLIINQTDYCGLADDINGTAATAFVIVHYGCATGYYSFGHEIGHIVGARHDIAHDGTLTPYAYGHGHAQHAASGGWRTIMTYACDDGSCPTRIQYWSNPSVNYGGVATGEATRENNARVWNERAATVAAFRSPPSGPSYSGTLYQLHNTGRIWRATGVACGSTCPGWQMLDNNPASVAITAGASALYQLHNTGRIWRYTGTPCSGASCPGWQMLDNNPASKAIVAADGALYQLHNTGRIWRYTGTPCAGTSCPGWQLLDNNPATKAIIASGGVLYQLHNTGRIWRYTGTPCAGTSCPGWQMLDNNPAAKAIAAAGGSLYQIHSTGKIWRFTGTACSGTSCPGWQMLDNNPAGTAIFANGGVLYQRHNTGRVWRYTGTPCAGTSCPGWQMLDNNPATVALAGDGAHLFQLHNTGRIWIATGVACTGASCPGWMMIDNNPATVAITGPNP
jgi:hypothetical protein